MNKISTELIVVIVAIAVFYLRIAMLRGQKKRLERDLADEPRARHPGPGLAARGRKGQGGHEFHRHRPCVRRRRRPPRSSSATT